jgi:hypothetical protein
MENRISYWKTIRRLNKKKLRKLEVLAKERGEEPNRDYFLKQINRVNDRIEELKKKVKELEGSWVSAARP